MKINIFLLLLTTLLLILNISITESAKILCLFPSPSKSHLIVTQALMKGLAEKGHDVTVVSGFAINKPVRNYRDIVIEKNEIINEMQDIIKSSVGTNQTFFRSFPKMMTIGHKLMNATINSPEFKKIMNEESFDLLIIGYFMNDFLMGVGAHFKCPIAILSTVDTFGNLNYYAGNPSSISHVPHMSLRYSKPMNFFQRLKNMFAGIVEKVMTVYVYSITSEYYNSNFPSDKYPSLDEVRKNVSLVMINHHFSQGNVRPYVPGMIEVGGLQIKDQPDPLPEDIQIWLDSNKNGAILFSMGSNFKGTSFPSDKLAAIIKTFSKLKQNVLWKYEKDLPNLPKNVKISKWLPQDDILAHPNVKLFISHGGLGSVMESKYHGVPIVGIPLFGDQMANIDMIENEGWAVVVPFSELSEEKLTSAILEVLNNSSYTETVKLWSVIYRDRPATALKTAIFWVEYVIRHKGAKHMQSHAVHLNFFQYHSLDVWVFVLVLLYIIFKLVCMIVKLFIRKCCRRKINSKTAKTFNKKNN